MKTLPAIVLAYSLIAPSLVRAQEEQPSSPPPAPPTSSEQSPPPEERPSTGVGLLVTGGVFTGVGVLNLLTAPLCKTDLIPDHDTQNACLIASLVVGGTFIAVGVPMILVGSSKRRKFKQWKASHPVTSGFGLAPARGGASLIFSGQF